MKKIPYGGHIIDEDDIKAVAEALRGDRITQGSLVDQFEEIIAKYSSTDYGVAVSSATAGLTLAYTVAGISRGDEVITTPLTFAATSNALVHLGAVPVFVDIDEKTLNIDSQKIEEKITSKTKAIVAVDFAGHPCNLDIIRAICDKYNLFLIEDASHSLGSYYKEKRVGDIADFTVFSFHPVKLITTGEGGVVVTNNQEWAEKMRSLRHHGVVKDSNKGGWYAEVEEPGYNFRITDFQCALGISQFNKIDEFIKKIREVKALYDDAFRGIEELIIPFEADYAKSAWHIYPIQFKLDKLTITRREIFDYLRQEGIVAQVHYVPLYLHSFYQKAFGYKQSDFPNCEKYYNQAITLPLFPKLRDEEAEKVIQVVKNVIGKAKKADSDKETSFQEKNWKGAHGDDYIERNPQTAEEMNELYKQEYGITRSELNKEFLDNLPRDIKILEVGCNVGSQLALLQKMGFKNLYGIDVNDNAIKIAKEKTDGINIICGSALDIPFDDNSFDLVFTSGVLIHISPNDIQKVISEIVRCAKKHIWGFEYYADDYIEIPYRGKTNMLWKANFVKLYLDAYPNLKLVKEKKVKYLTNENVDVIFLLEKQ